MLSKRTEIRVFFAESLNLIASYLFSRSVKLEGIPVGISQENWAKDDETNKFLDILEARHAIACGYRLQQLLPNIERKFSSRPVLIREESEGAILGYLDIPKYVSRRFERMWNKTYPIFSNQQLPDTPENTLVVQLLWSLKGQLGRTRLPRATAEGQACMLLFNWVSSRLKRWPWSSVNRVENLGRLIVETELRLYKRQTGNEKDYLLLLDLVKEWRANIQQFGIESQEKIVNGILAFPVDEFFQHKVFEVWCLKEIEKSVRRLGFVLDYGPCPLSERSNGPIYRLRRNSQSVDIWFQSQYPLNTPRWKYEDTQRPLAGIPDIILTTNIRSPLIIDAKFRQFLSDSRSNETYKMLGYLENFKDSFRYGFTGGLIFLGSKVLRRRLASGMQNSLTLVAIDLLLDKRNNFEQNLDLMLINWLEGQ